MKVERIRNATVISPDSVAALKTFVDLFSLATAGPAALAIGESRIEFETPAPGTRLGEALATSGEGMAEICLRGRRSRRRRGDPAQSGRGLRRREHRW